MDIIAVDIPFILLSTHINCSGETEKRILTPFGTLDVIFRWIWDLNGREPHFEIEVAGDTETWFLYDQVFAEFKKTVFDFVWKIAKKYLNEEVIGDFEELRVHIKGSEMNLRVPCASECTAEKTTFKDV